MSELEELKKRVAELEKAAKPAEPFKSDWKGPVDYTQGMSMPASAMRDLINAVPESVMRGLRADAQKPNPVTGQAAPQSQQVERGSGWREAIPIQSPPGIEHCDRMMDEQDKVDRAELALRL